MENYSITDSFRTVLKRQDFTLYVMMIGLLSIRQRRHSVPRAHNTFIQEGLGAGGEGDDRG